MIDEIKNLEKFIKNPQKRLPDNIFLFISRITPLINVDLLIKDKNKGILLTWRSKGEKYSEGWHFPGGIIRFRETAVKRVLEVAKNELKAKILLNKKPILISEIILIQRNRSHFISLLYSCTLISEPKIKECDDNSPRPGEYMWHKKCPKNIIKPHYCYKSLFKFYDFK
jgi:colanic acid biosynthesis protein WcaH